MIQWLVAPDFALVDQGDEATTLTKLRGVPTLLSFARCAGASDDSRIKSLQTAKEATKVAGVHHVTVYDEACPAELKGRLAAHPKAVESAYSVINRYPNEPYANEIPEAHFLIDRSGFVRARFRSFTPEDGGADHFSTQASLMKTEPVVTINLHSH
jgi:copper transport protein